MKNIEIVRGYRSFGHEDVYASDPAVTVVEGDVIDQDGALVTLSGAVTHKECGMVIERNMINGQPKDSGKSPVYVSNFVVRTSRYTPAVYAVNDPITVTAGLLAKGTVGTDAIWGYVTAINTDDTIDVRCNY
ncbi:MAG: hypothetical protein U9R24_07195 [Thermodesulfobacteriota bacterium]|nr:hypothetical protein [Thermodesulfobacteriota bacterium]